MKKVLFIDRDGVILQEPPKDYQVDSFEKLAFMPFVFNALSGISALNEYEFVMVTNQDGLGTSSFPEETFWGPHNLMLRTLESEGISFREICIDRTFPHENADTRKPGIGMLKHYLMGEFDMSQSYVIGDRMSDMLLAQNLGCKGIKIGSSQDTADQYESDQKGLDDVIVLRTDSWKEIQSYLRDKDRLVKHSRQTKETQIEISLNLDGTGKSDNQTGIGFFDHMLDQIAKHAQVDLGVSVQGDLHIDEHHTIEDTGLALGETFNKALGTKRGIERYGFALPMDDVEAQVTLDFGGRPWFVWNADFKREKVGEMPTEMFSHFFKSFSDTALCNLHITATGENEHHKIEGIFKAFSRAIKVAIKRDVTSLDLPSTKGVL